MTRLPSSRTVDPKFRRREHLFRDQLGSTKLAYGLITALALLPLAAMSTLGGAAEALIADRSDGEPSSSAPTQTPRMGSTVRAAGLRYLANLPDFSRLTAKVSEATRIVLDTETSGLTTNPASRVVSASFVKFQGQKPVEVLRALIEPGFEIENARFHGITNERIADTRWTRGKIRSNAGPEIPQFLISGRPDQVWREITSFTDASPVVDGYNNAAFDLPMLFRWEDAEGLNQGLTRGLAFTNVLDTQTLAFSGLFDPTDFPGGKIRLETLAPELGIDVFTSADKKAGKVAKPGQLIAHDDLDDVLITAMVRDQILRRHLPELLERYEMKPRKTTSLTDGRQTITATRDRSIPENLTLGELFELEWRIRNKLVDGPDGEHNVYQTLYNNRYKDTPYDARNFDPFGQYMPGT